MKNWIYLLLFTPLLVFSQNKSLTIEDAVLKQRSSLAPERLAQLQFIPGTHSFAWIGKKYGKEYVVMQNADDAKIDTVISIQEFALILDGTGMDLTKPERFPMITWASANEFRCFYENAFFGYQLKEKRIVTYNRLPKEAENAEIDTNSKKISFNMGNNVWAFTSGQYQEYRDPGKPSPDGVAKPKSFILTMDGIYGLQNGKAVHRNEFGINKGMFWSSKGTRLAYYKMYEGMVTNYPILDLEKRPAAEEDIKYPMAGATSHIAKIYVYDYNRKMSYPIITGTPDEQYLTCVTFSPNEEDLYVAILNRDQNELKFNKYDATTGAFIKTFFIETHAKYVEPEHAPVFVPGSPRYFIWQSRRDGFNQLYLYEQNGKFVRQLTKGESDVTELVGFNAAGTKAFYMASTNSGLERQCFSVEIETGKVTQITRNPGVHQVSFSDDGKYLLDSYSNTTTPRKTILMTVEGLEKSVVLHAQNPLMDYKSCAIKLFQINAADAKTKLNCRMITPPAFDSTKKYPVLVYLYGGPHAQLVTNSWLGGADMWLYYMAQQGYVVFTLDNRGSANRGADFEQATFRSLGTNERADQLEGVNWLKKQKYVDASRMGVYGWSFGGFMSIGMMTRTDVFKAGVAGGPVIDWNLYEIMYTERYMDKPVENPDGYKDADLTNYVKNLKGKLLVIHGTSDDVVVWQHSLTYLKKCVDEGVQVDYFVYPGHKHNVLGKDRVHLMQKITDYFKQNL